MIDRRSAQSIRALSLKRKGAFYGCDAGMKTRVMMHAHYAAVCFLLCENFPKGRCAGWLFLRSSYFLWGQACLLSIANGEFGIHKSSRDWCEYCKMGCMYL